MSTKLISIFSILFILVGCASVNDAIYPTLTLSRSIVKVQAISSGGKQNLGSGVVIAPDTVATNCHVMRSAKYAHIIIPEGYFPVTAESALPELDVCLLQTKTLNIPAIELADSAAVQVGDKIALSGFPFAMGRRTSHGKVTALHPYHDSHIIEINTGFNHGASGGGVFDKEGNLIGLMTFIGHDNSIMHFYAIPEKWIESALEQEFVPVRPFFEKSFWEKGLFLNALRNN